MSQIDNEIKMIHENIPINWCVVKLGKIANQITKGTTPTTAGYQYLDSGIPFIKIENINQYGIDLESVTQFISEEANTVLLRSQLKEGDILFSIAGTIGKTALVTKEYLPANTNQAVAIIRGTSGIFDAKYLRQQLRNLADVIAKNNARGGAMNNISLGDLKEITLSIPALAEQQQIAAKLDELLAQVDSIKTRLDAIPKILKRFRQSLLAAAVSGKLTEDWREVNSFDVGKEILLLKKDRDDEFNLLTEQQLKRSGQNSRKLDFSTLNDEPPFRDIPSDWKLIELGEIICYLTDYHANGSYETLKEHVELKENEDYACMIRATNFEKNNFSDLMIYISEEAYHFLGKSKLFGGEILIGKIGNAGAVYLMPNLNRPASLAMNLFAIRLSNKLVNSKYIYYFLKSHIGEQNIQKYVRGVATKSIDKKSLRSVYINFPSHGEQIEIVRRVDQLFAYADQIEQRVKDAQVRVNLLTQSTLAKAFRGELTADWRAQHLELISGENSAEALLNKIKAQQTAVVISNKRKACA